MTPFQDDDVGFLAWIDANRDDGFVVNHYRNPTPTYLKLHRASCGTLRSRPNPTSTDYGKECSTDLADLQAYAAQQGGELQPCGVCHPLEAVNA